ncbi:Uncharacterized protein Adt_35338 [Abeliophyllum distichum]|uniref:Uncharacterized protein n=1 Tax=Abeliophyllum distichum TaxID=126358 RepID=A0ABD1QEF2_9LAMI
MMLCCGKWDEFGRYVGCGEPSSLLQKGSSDNTRCGSRSRTTASCLFVGNKTGVSSWKKINKGLLLGILLSLKAAKSFFDTGCIEFSAVHGPTLRFTGPSFHHSLSLGRTPSCKGIANV